MNDFVNNEEYLTIKRARTTPQKSSPLIPSFLIYTTITAIKWLEYKSSIYSLFVQEIGQQSLLATAYNSIHSFKKTDIIERGGLSRLSSEDMLMFMEKKKRPCKEEKKLLFRGEIVYDEVMDELWLRDPDYAFDLRLAGLDVHEKATFAARNQNRSPYTVFRISVNGTSCFLNCVNPNSVGKEPQLRATGNHVNVDTRFASLDETVNSNRHESANSFAILAKSSKASSSKSTASKDALIGTLALQKQVPFNSSNATHMKLLDESHRRSLYANSLRYLCFTGIICQNVFAQLDNALVNKQSIPNQVVIRVENWMYVIIIF